jgi:alkaline phosphatase D
MDGSMIGRIWRAALVLASATLMSHSLLAQRAPHDVIAARVTHGVMAGDVTVNSVVIWSRADRASTMHVLVKGSGRERGDSAYQAVAVTAEHDYTGKIRITGLQPDREYTYTVWFGGSPSTLVSRAAVATGHFRTAPRRNDPESVTFAFGGDVAGQNVCRDAADGFPIFNTIVDKARPDFFVALGDMIYADSSCTPAGLYGNVQVEGPGPSATLNDFWAHWKYNREDAASQRLLARMPYYATWDDHEVINDFGPLHDTRPTAPSLHLMPLGLQATLDYNPILPARNTPNRLYRNVRWGKNLEMFILDTRQYRDANFEEDDPAAPKTMLGREQVAWLKSTLKRSDATWKLIVSSVPMSIPTGPVGPAAARDGWANYDTDKGFELELLDILKYMQQNTVGNVLWITTDVHFSEVFRYTPFPDHPDFQVHEVVTGPLNSGVLGKPDFDKTLGTESLFRSVNAPKTWADAKKAFNFGLVRIATDGSLKVSVTDINGASFFDLTLMPR